MEGLYQIQNRRNKLWGGLLIALGCVIKILPVVFIPYLIFRKEYKAAFYTLVTLVVLMLLPLPFFGLSFTQQLFSDWWGVINPTKPEYTYLQNAQGFVGIQSLSSFVCVFFSTDSYEGINASVCNLNHHQIVLLLNVLRGAFILFTLYFMVQYPFSLRQNKTQLFYEQAYIFLITPLIFPHQQKYAFVYIFPAYAFIYAFILFNRKNHRHISRTYYFLLALSFVLLTLTTDGLIGFKIGFILQYLKVITTGTFVLIILLALSRKED